MMEYTSASDIIIAEGALALAECDYAIAKLNADFLGITIDEYYDFLVDMGGMVEDTISPEELEQMYVEYCTEYDIPYEQSNDYACYDRMGW